MSTSSTVASNTVAIPAAGSSEEDRGTGSVTVAAETGTEEETEEGAEEEEDGEEEDGEEAEAEETENE